jgi:hypothetical protein
MNDAGSANHGRKTFAASLLSLMATTKTKRWSPKVSRQRRRERRGLVGVVRDVEDDARESPERIPSAPARPAARSRARRRSTPAQIGPQALERDDRGRRVALLKVPRTGSDSS